MSIRKLQEKDREALVALWKQVFPADPPHNEPSRVISAKLKVDDSIFVSAQDHRIVGACMAGYAGHRGWLYAVAVLPEYRRNGTGGSAICSRYSPQ
jgi:ribosomal protein S18 acetylase RimI-like enzyme